METQREFFADKLMDLANFAAVVLIFEQITKGAIRWPAFYLGAAFLLSMIMVSFVLRVKGRK